jgi:hypothetical protein
LGENAGGAGWGKPWRFSEADKTIPTVPATPELVMAGRSPAATTRDPAATDPVMARFDPVIHDIRGYRPADAADGGREACHAGEGSAARISRPMPAAFLAPSFWKEQNHKF